MRRKLIVIAVVSALAIFALGGAAIASTGGSGEDGGSSYLDRVAQILGIDSGDLRSAMQQARSEAASDRLAQRLSKAVDDGIITQDEADAIQSWFDGKPDALNELTPQQKFDLHDANRLGLVNAFLSGLVTDQVLTQDQADQISAWLGAKPTDALQKLRPQFQQPQFEFRGQRGFRGPRFGGFHGRGGLGFDFAPPQQPAPNATPESGSNTATGNPI